VKNFLSKSNKKPRPYWHVDAKWIAGLLFIVFFITSLLLYNFTQIISRENVVDTITTDIQNSLRQGLEEFSQEANEWVNQEGESIKLVLTVARHELERMADEVEQTEKQIKTGEGERVKPFEELDLYIEKNELEKYEKWAEVIVYRKLSKTLDEVKKEAFSPSIETYNIKEEIINKIEFPKVYSEEIYQRYRKISFIMLFISFILLFLVVFFSYRFGRLFSPGLLIAITSLPGFYIFNRANQFLKESTLNDLAKSDNVIIQTLASAVLNASNKQIAALYAVYKTLLIISIVLIIGSIIGKIIYTVYIRKKTATKKSKK
jgi:hypothetical protein